MRDGKAKESRFWGKEKSVKMSTRAASRKAWHGWGFESQVDDRFIHPRRMSLKNRWNGSKMTRDNRVYWSVPLS